MIYCTLRVLSTTSRPGTDSLLCCELESFELISKVGDDSQEASFAELEEFAMFPAVGLFMRRMFLATRFLFEGELTFSTIVLVSGEISCSCRLLAARQLSNFVSSSYSDVA